MMHKAALANSLKQLVQNMMAQLWQRLLAWNKLHHGVSKSFTYEAAVYMKSGHWYSSVNILNSHCHWLIKLHSLLLASTQEFIIGNARERTWSCV